MSNRINGILAAAAIFTLLFGIACAPEVGSDAWCTQMKEKDKGDWSANDAANFAKHCVFQ